MIRIYDQHVGQTAGVPVVTTGKGDITNDGLEAYAQVVSLVDGSGVPISNLNGIPVTSPAPTNTSATITSGTSLSAGVQVFGKLVGIITPSSWTAASMTFQGSVDNITFVDIWDSALGTATERTIASANIPTASSRFFPLALNDWLSVNYVKIRSGASGSPVNQAGTRNFTVVLAG